MPLHFPHIHLEKKAINPSIFLTSSILFLVLGDPDFSLHNITNLYISQATKRGIDVSARVNYFYQILLAGAVLTPVIYSAYFRLIKHVDANEKALEALQVISFTGISLIIADIVGVDYDKVILLLLLMMLSISGYLLLKNRFSFPGLFRIDPIDLYPFSVLIAFVVVTTIVFLFNSADLSSLHLVLILAFLPILLIIAFLWLRNRFGFLTRQIATALIPIAFIPLLLFFSIELVFYSKEVYGTFIPWKWFFVITTAGFTLLALPFVIKRTMSMSTTNVVRYFFLPAGLLCYVLCTQYSPVINQPTDMFELANRANSQMRMFKFDEWPLVDFMSSHLFSEQFYGLIYYAIFGYEETLGFLTYDFLTELVFYAIVVFFLVKLFGNGPLSLLFAVSFPILWYLFSKPVFPSILAFFMIGKLLRNQVWHHYFFLFTVLLFLLVWRIDTGVSAIFASILFLPLCYYTERIPVRVVPLLRGFGLFALLMALLVVPFLVVKGPDHIVNSLLNVYHYVSGSQGHGYASLSYEYPHQFYIFYVAFPAVALLMVFYIIHVLRHKISYQNKFERFSLSAGLFLFLVYFGNFQRGLVRHSFVEKTDAFVASTFFLAVALTLLPHLKPSSTAWRYVYFYGLGLGLVLSLKYYPIDKEASFIERFFEKPTITDIDNEFTEKNYKGRVRTDHRFAENRYKDLTTFLDSNLTTHQTFLDFSNAPMLYFYCQRPVPSYFCQNLQNSIDGYLQKDHIERIKSPSRVPVVVYSNYPPGWWDRTDGVPNAMRYYFLTAFIHNNYEPYGVIDNKRVWVKNDWHPKGEYEKPDTLTLDPQSYNYKKTAGFLASYLAGSENKRLDTIDVMRPKQESETRFSTFVSDEIHEEPAPLLQVKMDDPVPGQKLTVNLINHEEILGSSSFVTMKDRDNYIIPLFVHYSLQYAHVTDINVTSEREFYLDNLILYRDREYEP